MTSTATNKKIKSLKPLLNTYLATSKEAKKWGAIIRAFTVAELNRVEYMLSEEWADDERLAKRITDPKLTYLMSETDIELFSAEQRAYVETLGLEWLPEGNCPALYTENEQRKAARAMLIATGKALGLDLSPESVMILGPEKYQETIASVVGLIQNA